VVLYSIFAYASLAIISVAWLLLRERALGLILIGAAAAIVFGLQAGLKSLGRPARMAAQLVGAVGLTSTAAGAYYVATGALDDRAVILWAVNWLFAANQIHFVQVRIRGARAARFRQKFSQGGWFLLAEAATVLLLVGAWQADWLPGLAALAFLPVLLRGLYWFLEGDKPLVIHRLGFAELAHALVFGTLLILGFHF